MDISIIRRTEFFGPIVAALERYSAVYKLNLTPVYYHIVNIQTRMTFKYIYVQCIKYYGDLLSSALLIQEEVIETVVKLTCLWSTSHELYGRESRIPQRVISLEQGPTISIMILERKWCTCTEGYTVSWVLENFFTVGEQGVLRTMCVKNEKMSKEKKEKGCILRSTPSNPARNTVYSFLIRTV